MTITKKLLALAVVFAATGASADSNFSIGVFGGYSTVSSYIDSTTISAFSPISLVNDDDETSVISEGIGQNINYAAGFSVPHAGHFNGGVQVGYHCEGEHMVTGVIAQAGYNAAKSQILFPRTGSGIVENNAAVTGVAPTTPQYTSGSNAQWAIGEDLATALTNYHTQAAALFPQNWLEFANLTLYGRFKGSILAGIGAKAGDLKAMFYIGYTFQHSKAKLQTVNTAAVTASAASLAALNTVEENFYGHGLTGMIELSAAITESVSIFAQISQTFFFNRDLKFTGDFNVASLPVTEGQETAVISSVVTAPTFKLKGSETSYNLGLSVKVNGMGQ